MPKVTKTEKEVKEKLAKKPVKPVKGKAVKPAKVEAVKEEKAVKPAEVKAAKKVKTKRTPKRPANPDTGSVDFQIKNFSDKIATLAKHLKEHTHDFDSRRGLLIMVGKRRRLLNYVKKSEPEKYVELVKTLKLKK